MRLPRPFRNISRRRFLTAAASTAAAAATITILPGCAHDANQWEVPEPLIVDEDKAISVLEEYEEAELALKERAKWEIPLGSVLHEATGDWIGVTQAGVSASPMVKGSIFSCTTGALTEVIGDVRGDNHTRVIYDVRASDEVYAWVELDILTHAWDLFATSISAGKVSGDATKLWSADADFDPPGFVCTGNAVLWQVTPALSGSKTSESSFCYIWRLGRDSAQAVVESPGRFPVAPSVSGDLAILAPRVRPKEGVFYGVSAYALADDLATVVDQMVLPQTVRPFYATRIGDRFAVSIEANYSTGGMFGLMGTYIGPSVGPFIRLAREPSANVAGKDDTFIIKSRTSYFVVDVRKATYSILTAANRCVDYGEYPARVGEVDDFVTFATVKDELSGYPTNVVVRSFKL